MASKNVTREKIHSGVSQTKNDDKWSDMLNFRSSDNRTFVVPRRLGLLQMDAGLHTILHGVGDLNYAIGSKKSYTFRSHDGTEFLPLWRARIERTVTTQDQSENLSVRGSYTGSIPRDIRVTVVDGELVLDTNWPAEEVVVQEAAPVILVDCSEGKPARGGGGGGFSRLYLTVETLANVPKWAEQGQDFEVGDTCIVIPTFNFGHDTWEENNDWLCFCVEAYNTVNDTTSPIPVSSKWEVMVGWTQLNVPYTTVHDAVGTHTHCYHNGVVYDCIYTHNPNVSPELSEPGVGSNWTFYWTPIGIYSVPQIWVAPVPYLSGDLVRSGDAIYEALSNHIPVLGNKPPSLFWSNVTSDQWVPAVGAKLTVRQGTLLIGSHIVNANGLLTLNLLPKDYLFRVSYKAKVKHQNFTKTEGVQTLTIQIP